MIRALLLILVSLIIPESEHSCIISKDSRDISRNIFTYPETIQSDNFVIHFTESNADSQLVNGQWSNLQCNRGYAQSILDHAEAALSIYLQDGWENIPPDCDESITDLNSTGHCINFGGNSLYDIYLSNDGVGMVVPETPYPVEPYTGGYTSYMKISTLLNQYESIPSWSYHVVAHELHHSIQLRYGYSVSGNFGNYMYNGWLFEQTATYMENVIYPNSIHLSTMLGNCNVVTPLTYPHYNIDYPSEIYPYRSALWQKFLVESLEDSTIIREIWEAYGLEYSTGNPVSLFPIYNDAIELITENEINLSDAYLDYAIWRYFTGERSIPNQFFNESSTYCTASTISEFEGTFYLLKNKGASKYINLPSENLDLIITSDYIEDINLSHLIIGENNSMDIIQLVPENNNFYINISNTDSNIIVANSNFNDINSSDVSFAISIQSEILGDVNGDFLVNVQDIVIAVDLALNNEYVNLADLNSDNYIDILDIVQLINLILE